MGIHTVQFIAEIQKRPCLWNNTLENYSGNKLAKQQAWEEIAQIMFKNWSDMNATFRTEKLREIQKKWKGLRDYFARAKNNAPKNKDEPDRRKRRKAPSLKMLQFLNITRSDDGAPPEPQSEDSDSSMASSRAKSRKLQIHIETEELISAVHSKPVIWNHNMPEHNDKDLKHQAWMEIAANLYDDYSNLSERHKGDIIRHMQKKWKGLRDYFTRQKSKERMLSADPTRKRRAPFLTMLQFLNIPKQRDDDSQGAIKSDNDYNDSMHHEADSDASETLAKWSKEKKPRLARLNKGSRSMTSNSSNEKRKKADADMNFLLNILPDMKSMTPRQNFDFRFEVMKLIKSIKYNQPDEYYETTASSSRRQDIPVEYSWHSSGDGKTGKPPFRHQVIIHEYPRDGEDADMPSPLSNESAGSSVEDIKAILHGTSEEQSD